MNAGRESRSDKAHGPFPSLALQFTADQHSGLTCPIQTKVKHYCQKTIACVVN